MPIVPATDPPPGVESATARIVDDLCDAGTINVLDRSKLGVSLGHWVYELGLEPTAQADAAQPMGLMETVRRSGWSYLLLDDPIALCILGLFADPGDGQIKLSGLIYGSIVDELQSAVRQAEADPRVAAGRYELRELRIPGVHKSAVWFKDLNGGADIIIRVGRVPWFEGEEPSAAWKAATRRPSPTWRGPSFAPDVNRRLHEVPAAEAVEEPQVLRERKDSLDDYLRLLIPAAKRAKELERFEQPDQPAGPLA